MLSVVDEEVFQEHQLEEITLRSSTVSVVIPFYNNWQLTHQRLMELWRFTHVDEIILVNDASTEDVEGAVAWWQKEAKLPLRYIKNDKNLGFGKSMNKGIWASSSEIVVLLSNDVIVSGDVIYQVQRKIAENVLIGDTLYNFPTGWNVFAMPDGSRLFPYLGGYFLAAYRSSFMELGGFDDRYAPMDYEDVDVSTTALYMGYELLPLNSRYLKHISGQTAGKSPNREEITRRNGKKFYAKWKGILYENSSQFPDNFSG